LKKRKLLNIRKLLLKIRRSKRKLQRSLLTRRFTKKVVKKVKKVIVKQQKVAIKNTVKETTKKLVKVVCSNKEESHVHKCHARVKKAVKKHFEKVQKTTKKALNTCGCDVEATHHCSNSASATQTVVDCQSSYVKVCSKNCLKVHKEKVEKKTETLATKLCKGDTSCSKKVVHHTDKAVEKVNKKIVKVHIVKKVGVTAKQVKKAVAEKQVVVKGNKVIVNKKKVVELKETGKKVVEHKDTGKKVVEHKETGKKVVAHKDTGKKVLVDKILQQDDHKTIKQEIKKHATKCACEQSTTPAAKAKCRTECENRGKDLKKKVTAHISKESNCQEKSVIACGNDNSSECVSCKKSFILVCVTEEVTRKNELVSLLDECDSFLLEPSLGNTYNTVVFQP